MRYRIWGTSLLLFGSIFGSQAASACSCEGLPKTLSEAWETYPYIFSGMVKARKLAEGGRVETQHEDGTVTVTESPRKFDIFLEVDSAFKGGIPSFVVVRTSEFCQDPFAAGEYLVFADRAEGLYIDYGPCALSYSKDGQADQYSKYSKWLSAQKQKL